jgi:transposase-like protein
MIDFPIAELLDDSTCLIWLERHLYPEGFRCPHCGRTERRLFRQPRHFPAYQCCGCDGYYTLLSGTVLQNPPRPATLVLVLRGITKGESTARLAHELGMSRKQLHTLRQRVQANLHDTAPTGFMTGTTCEAGELSHSAGENKHAPSRPE